MATDPDGHEYDNDLLAEIYDGIYPDQDESDE